MQVILNIQADQIANLICSAIESGDPVTTASKGGWCNGIYYHTKSATPPDGNWYIDKPEWYESDDFKLEIHEVSDEDKWKHDASDKENIRRGALTIHTIDREKILIGLTVMAERFPHSFALILQGNTDAPCADVFLQMVVFGEEKYA